MYLSMWIIRLKVLPVKSVGLRRSHWKMTKISEAYSRAGKSAVTPQPGSFFRFCVQNTSRPVSVRLSAQWLQGFWGLAYLCERQLRRVGRYQQIQMMSNTYIDRVCSFPDSISLDLLGKPVRQLSQEPLCLARVRGNHWFIGKTPTTQRRSPPCTKTTATASPSWLTLTLKAMCLTQSVPRSSKSTAQTLTSSLA